MSLNPILGTTANELIRAALQEIGEADADQPIDAVQFSDGLRDLNMMVKSWQSQGNHLWSRTQGILFLDIGSEHYDLGPNADHACPADEFFDRSVTIAASAGATQIQLDGTDNLSYEIGQNMGIKLIDGTRQWVLITGIPNIGLIDFNIPLFADAEVGANVFFHNTFIDRPIRIQQVRRFTFGENDEIEAVRWSSQEYFAQPDKISQGQVNNWYYDPQLGLGRLYIWQVADNTDRMLKFTFERPLQVTEDQVDAPDFPSEWFDVIKTNLASRISIQYRIPQDRRLELKAYAAELLDNALGFDQEPSSINIQPDFG